MNVKLHEKVITKNVKRLVNKLSIADMMLTDFKNTDKETEYEYEHKDMIAFVSKCESSDFPVQEVTLKYISEFIGLFTLFHSDITGYLRLENEKFELLSMLSDNQKCRNYYMTPEIKNIQKAQYDLINNVRYKLENSGNTQLELFRAGYRDGYRARFNDIFDEFELLNLKEYETLLCNELFVLLNSSLVDLNRSADMLRSNTFNLINSKMKPITFEA